MYIQSAKIQNIRAIQSLELRFKQPAGWHVLIGDNGAGKSTLIRSLALALAGPKEAPALRQNWNDWLAPDKELGEIHLSIERDFQYDKAAGQGKTNKEPLIQAQIKFQRSPQTTELKSNLGTKGQDPGRYIWSNAEGWFSVAYGPFRRFTGGNKDWDKMYYSNPKLAAYLSAFGEDVALTEAIEWLRELKFKQLEDNRDQTLNNILKFIDLSGLLPHGSRVEEVTSEGVFCRDGANRLIPMTEMSDGYRSILSLTFELIRQLVKTYGADIVFQPDVVTNHVTQRTQMSITQPGVVLIDEIDAHLHPTWQTRIGEWFRRCFPNMQFIVTTHSPLVCRAVAQGGSIWRLAAPGSTEPSGEISGTERDRLIYGNILDAYGTQAFGQQVTRSATGHDKLDELAQLNQKILHGEALSITETEQWEALQQIFPTQLVEHA